MYHVTASSNVESILAVGLKPNFRPTRWVMDAARRRGPRGVFLAESRWRADYWAMTIVEWAELDDDDHLIILAVDVAGLPIEPNSPDDAAPYFPGDWLCLADVPPGRISLAGELRGCHVRWC